MAFGTALGADPKVLYEVIRNAAGGSWMFNNRVPHMLEDDYTPRSACDIWVKDLGMVLGIARDLRMPLPIAAAAYQVAMMAAAQGLGPIDDAGFVKVYESFTGKRIAAAKGGGTGNERAARLSTVRRGCMRSPGRPCRPNRAAARVGDPTARPSQSHDGRPFPSPGASTGRGQRASAAACGRPARPWARGRRPCDPGSQR